MSDVQLMVCTDCGALGVSIDKESFKDAAREHLIDEHEGTGTMHLDGEVYRLQDKE